MPSPYRAIFSAPGSRGFSAAGFVGRLPLSMMGIGIVTMISQLTGRYGLAGALSAMVALSAALIGPQISRLVDLHGQRRVLRLTTLVALAAVSGLLLSAQFSLPDWTLFLFAAGIGAVPSIGSMVRARWAALYRDQPRQLHTAYSFESVVDEACFIFGPIVSIGLSTTWFPEAGPLLAAVFLAAGVFSLTAQRSTEPVPHPREHHTKGSALRSTGLQVLVGTFVATGAIFGAIDVVTVAFAEEQGHKGAASLVLATYAAGSCLAGVVFGLLHFGGAAGPQVAAGGRRDGREYDPPPTGREPAVSGRGTVRGGPVHRADDDHDDGPRRAARAPREADRRHDLGEYGSGGRRRSRLVGLRLGDRRGGGEGGVLGSGGRRGRRGPRRVPGVPCG